MKDTFLTGALKGNFLASFAVGWLCTTVGTYLSVCHVLGLTCKKGASLVAYPLDTIRRRMMMTSGEKVTATKSPCMRS